MSRFRQATFIGVVISLLIALLIALMRSEEMRRQLSKRLEELWNALPESERLKQSAQQAATKMRETGSALGELVQQSGSRVKPLRQEDVSTAGPSAPELSQSEQARSTTPDEGREI
jgi:gas vesicle protein